MESLFIIFQIVIDLVSRALYVYGHCTNYLKCIDLIGLCETKADNGNYNTLR